MVIDFDFLFGEQVWVIVPPPDEDGVLDIDTTITLEITRRFYGRAAQSSLETLNKKLTRARAMPALIP
ncbi:hypothetical protein Scep_002662 [Stephania cephalantha]|uniref:Uncharacterized protein n=1 Tax=Stephania cephalantha TaxID=152367 RepID=A0AAP0Q8Z7_9MAGN